jgi:DNA-binding transcriptional ArsR family regulator
MPLSTEEELTAITDRPEISISLEPALNSVYSLLMLARVEKLSGLGEWIVQTAQAMTPEERRLNDLVIIGFYYAVTPRRSWSSFPAYLDYLALTSPVALRDKMLEIYALIQKEHGQPVSHSDARTKISAMLESQEAYLEFLRQAFGPDHVDVEIETQAYRYVTDPPAMKELIIGHLRHMWEKYLSNEWERVRPVLQSAVNVYRKTDLNQMSRLEASRWVTGQELNEDNCEWLFKPARRVVFVPNAHVGPYLGKYQAGDTLWVLFGARPPKGLELEAPDLSRAELVVHLAALADDNRLRILKYIADKGETRSQDLIQALDLSQSAASRNLTQLTATGYLQERRCDGAKCYTLKPELVEETLRALSGFLLKR